MEEQALQDAQTLQRHATELEQQVAALNEVVHTVTNKYGALQSAEQAKLNARRAEIEHLREARRG